MICSPVYEGSPRVPFRHILLGVILVRFSDPVSGYLDSSHFKHAHHYRGTGTRQTRNHNNGFSELVLSVDPFQKTKDALLGLVDLIGTRCLD